MVTGIFDPARPLASRVILLRSYYLCFTLYFGVRVNSVISEVRETDHGPEEIFGFSYQTLQGHFEQGQSTFEVIKKVNNGKVIFKIRVVSRPAYIPNPLFRLGFELFGRRVQKRFATRSLVRMAALVHQRLLSPTLA
jgi:uncharacterized protein (UPF0548 family)